MRECLNDILNENCLLTLAQMNEELRRRLPGKPRIHSRTIARTLEGMLFTLKLARPLPADRNRPDVMAHAVFHHWVFTDECGFNIWTSRSQGRALRGERAYRQVCGQRGRNVTVRLAVSATNGLVFHSAMIGGMNRQRFSELLAQTRENLDPEEDVIFIYDEAPAHNNPTNPADHTELKKLPPYSPFLNIVEQAI